MGMIITVLLAVIIFGVGLGVFYKTIKKEVVEGTCASCGHKGSCHSGTSTCSEIKTVQFKDADQSKKE